MTRSWLGDAGTRSQLGMPSLKLSDRARRADRPPNTPGTPAVKAARSGGSLLTWNCRRTGASVANSSTSARRSTDETTKLRRGIGVGTYRSVGWGAGAQPLPVPPPPTQQSLRRRSSLTQTRAPIRSTYRPRQLDYRLSARHDASAASRWPTPRLIHGPYDSDVCIRSAMPPKRQGQASATCWSAATRRSSPRIRTRVAAKAGRGRSVVHTRRRLRLLSAARG